MTFIVNVPEKSNLFSNRNPPNKANAADCPSWVLIDGVLPVTVSQIGASRAGEVHFHRRGVLCSALSDGIGYSCSR